MTKELQLIKNKYGEEMMHFARENFSTILEQEGLLFELLSNHFDYSKSLLIDIKKQNKEEQFINYIYSLSSYEYKNSESVNKTPEELLSEAGYILYECKTEEDIQSFKKYYANYEKLCTFNGGRLNRCHVFFAVKKDVDSIKRQDFKEPERQDLYGTSVISIQFTKGSSNILSIKNRYNHAVSNPDATFSNNLENIIPGLTKAFENKYNLNIKSNKNNLELKNYVMARDEKYYKYNYEFCDIYYCSNNVIIDKNNANRFDKDRYLIFDYFILDMKEKNIKLYNDYLEDSFIDDLDNIEKIEIHKNNNQKNIIINNDIEIGLDNENNIISYKNNNIKTINNNFLEYNKKLSTLKLDNVESIGDYFLLFNKELKEINLPQLESIGNDFLYFDEELNIINLPQLKSIGNGFLRYNEALEKIDLPQLESLGNAFLCNNQKLKEVNLPHLYKTGEDFLYNNRSIKSLNLPNLEVACANFLANNGIIKDLYLPNLKIADVNFLRLNQDLEVLNLPNLEKAYNNFIEQNEKISQIYLPKLIYISSKFLLYNKNLKVIDLPSVKFIDSNFLVYNYSVKHINLPSVEEIGSYFLYNDSSIETISMPKLNKEKYDEIVNRFSYLKKKEYDFIHHESRVDKAKRLIKDIATKKRV